MWVNKTHQKGYFSNKQARGLSPEKNFLKWTKKKRDFWVMATLSANTVPAVLSSPKSQRAGCLSRQICQRDVLQTINITFRVWRSTGSNIHIVGGIISALHLLHHHYNCITDWKTLGPEFQMSSELQTPESFLMKVLYCFLACLFELVCDCSLFLPPCFSYLIKFLNIISFRCIDAAFNPNMLARC